jgi:hypothetical protein
MTDEGVMLVHSREVMEGTGPYGPTECPYTPLAFFLQAAWMRAAGEDLVTARVPVILMAALTAVCVFGAMLRFSPPLGAWLAAFTVVAATFPYQCYASYNNYALFFVTASACALVATRDASARALPFLGGALAAGAFFCKQNLGGLSAVAGGAALIVAASDLRGAFRQSGIYSAGGLVMTAVFMGFAAYRGFLGEMFGQAISGGLEQGEHFAGWYPFDQADQFANLLKNPSLYQLDALAHSLSFMAPFPVAGLLAIVAWHARRRGDAIARPAAILAAMSPILHLGAIHAPTTWHIIFTKSVPIMALSCLLVWLAMRPRALWVALTIGLSVTSVHLGRLAMIFDDYTGMIRAPLAEGIRTRDWEAEVINTALDAMESVPPTTPVFVAAVDPMYYYLTERKPPVRWIYLDPSLVPETVGRELVEKLRGAEADVLLINGRNPWYDYLQIAPLRDHINAMDTVTAKTVNGVTVALYRGERPPG